MKFISWNINGLRAWITKDGTIDFLHKENPDFICFQETKAQTDQIESLVSENFSHLPYRYFHQAVKKGYSSTAILAKHEPLSVTYGIKGLDLASEEGRVITLEYKNFYLITVYTPNSKPDLARVDLRHDSWDKAQLQYIKKLEKKKPVIYCGDLNVAHTPLDLKNDKTNRTTEKFAGNPGATDKERAGFENYMKAGLVDTFRFLYPDKIQYSWWSYRSNARASNAGWRIDYFLTSDKLKKKITEATIYDQAHGSDHCPIGLELNIK